MAARRPLPRPIADWLRVFGPGAIVASLPTMLLLMSVVCMPIWISFHSGVLGNLTSWVTGTRGMSWVGGAGDLQFALTRALGGRLFNVGGA